GKQMDTNFAERKQQKQKAHRVRMRSGWEEIFDTGFLPFSENW
ncbi:hypothetical protein GBF38_012430, partial [Nibea albiflora]